jgi:alpha-tubulin suppressor-like RCC1 family protein
VRTEDGRVYATGWNDYGQLGVGNEAKKDEFTRTSNLSGATDIAAGYYHSIALTSNGKVYTAGWNYLGQLGLGDSVVYKYGFAEVPSLSGVKAIAAGYYHSLALTNGGEIYATGSNTDGRLGVGDDERRNSFTRASLPTGANITAIAAGGNHSLALDGSNGKVYAAGSNGNGQLGFNSGSGDKKTFTEVPLPAGANIKAIAAGYAHSLALDNNGKVYATGFGNNGRLGLGSSIGDQYGFAEVPLPAGSNIIAIAAGGSHSFLLDNNGSIYAAGEGYYGQLGLGSGSDENIFTEVPSLSGVDKIAGGGNHSLALTDDNKLYATGLHGNGELGLGETTNVYIYNFTEVGF